MSKGVQRMFSQIPRTYETVNHVLTLGFDMLWRRQAAKLAVLHEGGRFLEVCSGTGELSIYLSRSAGRKAEVVSADFSLPMLTTTLGKLGANRLHLALADAKKLPFPDESFDLIAISFATRNINISRNKLIETFGEFRRVLKPGGLFINLETSQPQSRFIRWLFHLYVRLFVKPIGHLISGSMTGYGYLSHTVRHFYDAEALAGIMSRAGFVRIDFHHLLLGLAAIHRALK
ncbi:MAG: ubiquinone/menaquinone biosynthesis methyltransferase [Candidatus Thorarchaeota archaeon]